MLSDAEEVHVVWVRELRYLHECFHLVLMDTCMHTQTGWAGNDRPQPFRGQSSNSVVMRGQKEAREVTITEKNKLPVFLVKSAATVDLCWSSTSQEHHPRPGVGNLFD